MPCSMPCYTMAHQGIKAFDEEENGLWLGLVPACSRDMALGVQNAPDPGAVMCSRSGEQW